eukprot:COSAG05_NODE_3896_length_1783_cov_45.404988_3_plen_63_part_00
MVGKQVVGHEGGVSIVARGFVFAGDTDAIILGFPRAILLAVEVGVARAYAGLDGFVHLYKEA